MASQEKANDLHLPNRKGSANMEFSPLVSVITPVLNGRKYLEKCIESVLSQSYPHVEHVFVDGGSSDGTLDILKRYNQSYPQRVRFITGTDKTPEDAWNKGLLLSKGDILGWLGSDDTYTPDALRTVVEFFTLNPDASFVFGICDVIDQNDQLMGQSGTEDFVLEEMLDYGCRVPTCSAFYKR
ncbi:MAG: glycosyltransferase family 2 protein, partial [Terriglobia bacterium]